MRNDRARLFLLLLAVMLFAASGQVAAQETPSLFVDPAVQTVGLGNGTFEVRLMVDDVTTDQGLGGYTLVMAYDPSVVQGLAIEDSGYVASTGNAVVCPSSGIDDNTGRLALFCFTVALFIEPLPGPQTSEPQVLARVTFEPVAEGTTTLGISETTISDAQGNTLAATTLNGEITVAEPTEPAPTSTPTGTPSATQTPTAIPVSTTTGTPTATTTPSATPTATATTTPTATATTTPTHGAITPTPTTTPAALPGDVDCGAGVSSVDAALVLQYDAGIIGWLPCPDGADVNGDGATNAIDAALILQFVAGLIVGLPP